MSLPFRFNRLNQRTKILVVALSIFLVSLSIGMLVFGAEQDFLTTDTLSLGSEAIHHISH